MNKLLIIVMKSENDYVPRREGTMWPSFGHYSDVCIVKGNGLRASPQASRLSCNKPVCLQQLSDQEKYLKLKL
jgi:hypothetical protein